jgi:hypothetical protein
MAFQGHKVINKYLLNDELQVKNTVIFGLGCKTFVCTVEVFVYKNCKGQGKSTGKKLIHSRKKRKVKGQLQTTPCPRE